MDKTEARAIIKCLQKKDMTPEDTLTFELLQDFPNSLDSAPTDFYLFPKLKSHLFGRHFGNNSYCRGVLE